MFWASESKRGHHDLEQKNFESYLYIPVCRKICPVRDRGVFSSKKPENKYFNLIFDYLPLIWVLVTRKYQVFLEISVINIKILSFLTKKSTFKINENTKVNKIHDFP